MKGIVGTAHSMSLWGLHAMPVLIEAVILSGLPGFTIVGLPDAAVNEARERLKASFAALGLPWPNSRLTVNLSPGDLAKQGTGFDLGLAVAILGAQGFHAPGRTVFLGELGLDGSVRAVKGVLPALLSAQEKGFVRAILPAQNIKEAQLVEGIEAIPVWHLESVAALLGVPGMQEHTCPAQTVVVTDSQCVEHAGDLADVCGQEEAIAALEVAAAGGHHILMVGPPGVGKSMLAMRMPAIMPDLDYDSAVTVAAISSLCGNRVNSLPIRPPVSAPHHSATIAALIGGGSGIPQPGAVTRAHAGILFCDEFPEFSSAAIQALRQPLENGYIDIHRAKAHVHFPARFQLVAAANPCRCGKAFDGGGACTCTSRDRRTYTMNLGGPVRNRIDINIRLNRPSHADLRVGGTVSTAQIKERVIAARERQKHRLQVTSVSSNAQLPGTFLRKNTHLDSAAGELLERALTTGELSMRGVDRILRLAWTVADLAEHDKPTTDDVFSAFTLRGEMNNG